MAKQLYIGQVASLTYVKLDVDFDFPIQDKFDMLSKPYTTETYNAN